MIFSISISFSIVRSSASINLNIFNKVKNLWYQDSINSDGEKERKLLDKGYKFIYHSEISYIELYEANIPPLLRFFHIREISPSGWIAMPIKKTVEIKGSNKTTSCDYEFVINYKNIIALNHKEDRVPYKIMSFDIEASSSHGDFPVPIKSYKKLATNIVDYFTKLGDINTEQCKVLLRKIIRAAFGKEHMENIDLVYPKEQITDENDLLKRTENWLKTKVRDRKEDVNNEHLIETLFVSAATLAAKAVLATKAAFFFSSSCLFSSSFFAKAAASSAIFFCLSFSAASSANILCFSSEEISKSLFII